MNTRATEIWPLFVEGFYLLECVKNITCEEYDLDSVMSNSLKEEMNISVNIANMSS